MTLKIESVMTESPHTIGGDQNLEFAKQRMAELGVRHLPVLDGGKCIGILSDRDVKLVFAVEPNSAPLTKVSDACTVEVFTVEPGDTVKSIAQIMARDQIGSVIVMKGEQVVGIFTTTDACAVLAKVLP